MFSMFLSFKMGSTSGSNFFSDLLEPSKMLDTGLFLNFKVAMKGFSQKKGQFGDTTTTV